MSALQSTELAWLINESSNVTEEVADRSIYTYAEPAKWTVISTGVVIWAVRLGHVITAFASTATAWFQFDPLTVIQQTTKNDDRESTHLSERMFELAQKKS